MFGKFETKFATGMMLGHRLTVAGKVFAKGHTLSLQDVAFLLSHGISDVLAHRFEEHEIDEVTAADILGVPFAKEGIYSKSAVGGRVNFYAKADGLFIAERDLINSFNSINQAVTFACLDDRSRVAEGDLVGTLKIIPLAVAYRTVETARLVASARPPIYVRPFESRTVSLVSTTLPSLSAKIIEKTTRITADRLMERGSTLVSELHSEHNVDALAGVLREEADRRAGSNHLVIVFGASAVADANDIIPAAIREAGGKVERVEMPVDPGNLVVIGAIGDIPVIGAPGCARSPSLNGLDWVLDRLLAGDRVDSGTIARMGVGGLLKEISSRPQLREAQVRHGGMPELWDSA
ncbi:molybdopterin-binding protein [Rhizobium sp. CNPSo 3968]|uniref:molybdopterin-binding protein n=1 Tax=Rhizobium sp. CNPSo 3968 TaxID=3021408 RepID=UPI00254FEFB7|nr:molybdopterin-binding protein [Rhizobium sp. CNPSo 3968]MDK4723129.1 molybdopterin-binding protein [Rhizobium sp. CNPSo 3968]